jgi:hypothetical protein
MIDTVEARTDTARTRAQSSPAAIGSPARPTGIDSLEADL